jgi:TPP-dependent 2-oxoacid decarboxylase
MNNFTEIQKALTLAEKMLKDCTEESKPVYLETVKQANEKLQKMLSDPQVFLPAVIKSEPKKLDQHIRTIERTVASQHIFHGNNDKEA